MTQIETEDGVYEVVGKRGKAMALVAPSALWYEKQAASAQAELDQLVPVKSDLEARLDALTKEWDRASDVTAIKDFIASGKYDELRAVEADVPAVTERIEQTEATKIAALAKVTELERGR